MVNALVWFLVCLSRISITLPCCCAAGYSATQCQIPRWELFHFTVILKELSHLFTAFGFSIFLFPFFISDSAQKRITIWSYEYIFFCNWYTYGIDSITFEVYVVHRYIFISVYPCVTKVLPFEETSIVALHFFLIF